MQSLAGGAPEILLTGGRAGRWVGRQYFLYARGGDVFARRWDGTDSAALGPAAPVRTGVQSGREITGTAHFDVSDSGVLAFIPGDVSVARGRRLVWRNRDGAAQYAPIEPLAVDELALSGDGTRVAVALQGNNGAEIWIYDVESGAGTRLTAGGFHGRPLWSADDRWIYYVEVTSEGDFGSVSRVRADGSEPPEPVLAATGDYQYRAEAITADGRTLVVDRVRIDANSPDVLMYDMESGDFDVVVDSEVAEYNGRLSPNGRYLLYATSVAGGGRRTGEADPALILDARGEGRLHVRDLESRATQPVAPQNAHYAQWSVDGSELFYVREGTNSSDVMMRIPIAPGEGLRFGQPQELFEVDISVIGSRGFSVTADGQRFLYSATPRFRYSAIPSVLTTDQPDEVRVVVGWLGQLQDRVSRR